MIPKRNDLLPMEGHPTDLLTTPGVFVCLEVGHGRQILGTFQGWDEKRGWVLIETPNGALVKERASSIVKGWWAPMGYRT